MKVTLPVAAYDVEANKISISSETGELAWTSYMGLHLSLETFYKESMQSFNQSMSSVYDAVVVAKYKPFTALILVKFTNELTGKSFSYNLEY